MMIGMLLLLSLAPLMSWAQATAIPSSGTYTMTPSDGIQRTFRVHLPTSYSGSVAMPLVLLFHGWGGNENEFLGAKGVTSLANQRGYILVAPRGLGSNEGEPNSWTFSGSDTGKDGDGVNLSVPGDTDAICGPGTPNYRYPSCATKYPGDQSNTCSRTQCQTDDIKFTQDFITYLTEHLNVNVSRKRHVHLGTGQVAERCQRRPALPGDHPIDRPAPPGLLDSTSSNPAGACHHRHAGHDGASRELGGSVLHHHLQRQ